jgi:hypothetical protein
MDVSVDTTVNTDSIILLIVGIMIAGAFIVLVSKMAKKSA